MMMVMFGRSRKKDQGEQEEENLQDRADEMEHEVELIRARQHLLAEEQEAVMKRLQARAAELRRLAAAIR